MKRLRKIVSQVLFYATLLLIVVASAFFILQKRSGQPLFFKDYSLMWVETGSMQPTIPERSYILVHRSENMEPQVGDVIVFLCRDTTSPVYGHYVTHRIVARTEQGYKTQGDSTLSLEDPWTVEQADILAMYTRNLPLMTKLGRIFSTPMGMVMVFALFFAVCGFVCIPSIVKTLKPQDTALTAEELDELVQQELQRLEKEGLDPKDDLGSST